MDEKLICPECGTETPTYTFDENDGQVRAYEACVCPNCEWALVKEITERN